MSREIRFFNPFEQLMQIKKHGMKDSIIDQILPSCITNKWSETSSLNLMNSFGTQEKKANLGMAIFEATVVSEVGDALCKACYKAEGDSPLILTADDIFSKLESSLMSNGQMPTLEAKLDEVVNLIAECEEPFLSEQVSRTENIDTLKEMITAATSSLSDLRSKKRQVMSSGTSSFGRSRNISSRALDTDSVLKINDDMLKGKIELKKRKADLKRAEEMFCAFNKTYDELKYLFPTATKMPSVVMQIH